MSLPRRLIHNEYDLQDIAEQQDRPIELIELAVAKFTLVKQGDRRGRIESNIEAMGVNYDETVQ